MQNFQVKKAFEQPTLEKIWKLFLKISTQFQNKDGLLKLRLTPIT